MTSCQRWKSSCCWDFDILCTWSLSKQYYTCCYGILSFVRLDKSCSIKIYSGPWATSLTWFLKKKNLLFLYTYFISSSTRGKYEVKSSHGKDDHGKHSFPFTTVLYYKIILYYIVHQQGLLPKLHVFLSKKKH